MPTNEERREVAARLRNYANLRESFKESPICAFINALGFGGYLDWKGVCSRIADLIEPEPERTCTFSVKEKDGDPYPTCSECGYETDFGELMWYFDNTFKYENKYCPNCGAKAVE